LVSLLAITRYNNVREKYTVVPYMSSLGESAKSITCFNCKIALVTGKCTHWLAILGSLAAELYLLA